MIITNGVLLKIRGGSIAIACALGVDSYVHTQEPLMFFFFFAQLMIGLFLLFSVHKKWLGDIELSRALFSFLLVIYIAALCLGGYISSVSDMSDGASDNFFSFFIYASVLDIVLGMVLLASILNEKIYLHNNNGDGFTVCVVELVDEQSTTGCTTSSGIIPDYDITSGSADS